MFANDLSLSLKSETFSALKEDFDSILARTIGNMEMKGAEEATVTLKLGISLEKSSVNSPSGLQAVSYTHLFRLEDIHTALQYTERKAKLNGKGDDYIPVLFENELRDFVMREIINTRGRMNKCVIPAT